MLPGRAGRHLIRLLHQLPGRPPHFAGVEEDLADDGLDAPHQAVVGLGRGHQIGSAIRRRPTGQITIGVGFFQGKLQRPHRCQQ
ncbi:hypothetical protein SDC9_198028 [bioreactor metagenome]|uniref:Uncharacterized protein n=1 Tax=bioreactor metagenome TaxID=1076179 RepID=A0A645IHU3_9ZZZZ